MKEKLPEYTVQQIRDMLDASEGFDPEAGVFSLLKAYARLEAERDRLKRINAHLIESLKRWQDKHSSIMAERDRLRVEVEYWKAVDDFEHGKITYRQLAKIEKKYDAALAEKEKQG